jgi:uncharacterized protein involved in exopolysaccharide biosynthesis
MTQVDTEILGKVAALTAPEPSLIDLLTILLEKKRFILAVSLAGATAAAVIASFLPVSYKAEAVILPFQQAQPSLAAFASGALGGLAGTAAISQIGLKSPGDLYVGLLASHSIADAVVQRFHLREVYKKKLASDARKALLGHVTFVSGKDSLIKITAEDHDPKRAADLANAFVEELHNQSSRITVTDAAHRRLFFEQQLANERDALADAEIALKNTQQSTGMVSPDGQAAAVFRATAELRSQIVSREVQLQAMRWFATDDNPQLQVLQQEISGFRSQLAGLEENGGSKFELSVGKLPQASLEYIRKLRGLKYHETLYDVLARQYEAARIDEAKQAPLIQVVDNATVPDRKTWPPRGLLTVAAGMAGLVLASAWVLITGAIRNLAQTPAHAMRLESLKNALRF